MRKAFTLLSIILLSSGILFAQDGNSAIIYGPDWAYLIVAPDGYALDNRSLQKKGIWGLFYKMDQSSYQADKLHICIKPFQKGGEYPDTVDSLIRWDLGSALENIPGLVATYYKDIELGDFTSCKVFKVDDDDRKNYLLQGYVTEKRASFVFVLMARSKEEREQNEKPYTELLASFVYMEKE